LRGFEGTFSDFPLFSRDLRETKHRLEVTSSEVKKKDGQLKEIQLKLEQGDGCELIDGSENDGK
jgi:hypothetical protein